MSEKTEKMVKAYGEAAKPTKTERQKIKELNERLKVDKQFRKAVLKYAESA